MEGAQVFFRKKPVNKPDAADMPLDTYYSQIEEILNWEENTHVDFIHW